MSCTAAIYNLETLIEVRSFWCGEGIRLVLWAIHCHAVHVNVGLVTKACQKATQKPKAVVQFVWPELGPDQQH